MANAYDFEDSPGPLDEPEVELAVIEDVGPVMDPTVGMIVSEIQTEISQAVTFDESELAPDRERSQKYYNGESDLAVDGNRSKYVATKVLDIVRGVKPDLMRVFLSSDRPVEFVPDTVEEAPHMRVQSQYVTQLFHRRGGYRTIYDAFHTSMLHKIGVVKSWYERVPKREFTSLTGMTEQQLQELEQSGAEIDVIDETTVTVPDPASGAPMPMTLYDVEAVRTKDRGQVMMAPIPPEEFIIDRNATSEDDYRLMGHRREMRRGDALAMGLPEDKLDNLDSQSPEESGNSGLSGQRRKYFTEPGQDQSDVDETMEDILITEVYYRADLDDTGTARLYRWWFGGTHYEYLDHEEIDEHPFSLFMIDPEPFTVYGHSLYDISHSDQDVITSLARAVIDNAHMTNNPRLSIHENLVNVDDVLSNDLGAPIRNRAAGNVQVIDVPFTGQGILPLIENLEKKAENRTGVTRASMGLDPDAMQSTDKAAVQNTIRAAKGQVELMARNLGETGLKHLFRRLLRLSLQNPDPVSVMEVAGTYVPAPLKAFDAGRDALVRVGTGSGSPEEKVTTLDYLQTAQRELVGSLGVVNPVVSLRQIYNTIEDRARLGGIHDVSRYITPVTEEIEKQVGANIQSEKDKDRSIKDPANAIVKAEEIKGVVKMKTEAQKHQLDVAKLKVQAQHDAHEAQREEDLKRDKMIQDLYLKIAELQSRYAAQVNAAEIQAEQQRNNQNAAPNNGTGATPAGAGG
jgi:hypothetical protein